MNISYLHTEIQHMRIMSPGPEKTGILGLRIPGSQEVLEASSNNQKKKKRQERKKEGKNREKNINWESYFGGR